MNGINLLHYAGFLGITLIFIVLVLRAFLFSAVKKVDPIKAVLPADPTGLYKFMVLREKIKQNHERAEQMS